MTKLKNRAAHLQRKKMNFPRLYKKPRGSNLNNEEVQYLIQTQEGKLKKGRSSY